MNYILPLVIIVIFSLALIFWLRSQKKPQRISPSSAPSPPEAIATSLPKQPARVDSAPGEMPVEALPPRDRWLPELDDPASSQRGLDGTKPALRPVVDSATRPMMRPVVSESSAYLGPVDEIDLDDLDDTIPPRA